MFLISFLSESSSSEPYKPQALRQSYFKQFDVPKPVSADKAWVIVPRPGNNVPFVYNIVKYAWRTQSVLSPEEVAEAGKNFERANHSLKQTSVLETPLVVGKGEILGIICDYEFPDNFSEFQVHKNFPRFAWKDGPLFEVFIDCKA